MFGMFPFAQHLHPMQHLSVVGHAQCFPDVALHFGLHGGVKPRQPVYLIGKDGYQGRDDGQCDVFQGQFHATKIMLFRHVRSI
jgi:hypothetical protein